METVTAKQTRDLLNRVIVEFGDKNTRVAAARISRETGLTPGYIQAACSQGGLSYLAYRAIGIIFLEDPGAPKKIHPDAEEILITHGIGMGGE